MLRSGINSRRRTCHRKGKKKGQNLTASHEALGGPLSQCVQEPEATDPDYTCCRHLSSALSLCLAKKAMGLPEGWPSGTGSELVLPFLLPKQLTSSDVVLWLHSVQPAHVDMVYFQFLTVSHVDFPLGSKSDPCSRGLYN